MIDMIVTSRCSSLDGTFSPLSRLLNSDSIGNKSGGRQPERTEGPICELEQAQRQITENETI